MGNEASQMRQQLEGLQTNLELLALLHAAANDKDVPQGSVLSMHGWDPKKKPANVELSDDGTTARLKSNSTVAIRGKEPYSEGRHCFNVQWSSCTDERIVIGLASDSAELTESGSDRILGATDDSFGLDLMKNKIIFDDNVVKDYPRGKTLNGEIIMILDMDKGILSFKSNGEDFGPAMSNIVCIDDSLYVAAEMNTRGDTITIQYLGSQDVSQTITSKDELRFSELAYGKNLLIQEKGKRAVRKNPKNCFDYAAAMSNRPLADNEMFKVLLVTKDTSRYVGSCMIGVTTVSPTKINFTQAVISLKQEGRWILHDNKIDHDGKTVGKIDQDIDDLGPGATLGVKKKGNTLYFYVNGKEVKSLAIHTSEPVYGIVDIYGQATSVEILAESGNDTDIESEEENQPRSPEQFLEGIQEVVDELKKKTKSSIPNCIKLVYVKLDQMYHAMTDRKLRSLAAEKLATMDAAIVFSEYWKFLLSIKSDDNIYAGAQLGIEVLLSVIWNYCDNSLLLSKKMGEAGVIKQCIEELSKAKKSKFVKYYFGILHNCAKAIENKQIYQQNNFMKVSSPFCDTKSNDKDVSMTAVFTRSYVYEDNQVGLLEVPEPTAQETVNTLSNAIKDTKTLQHNGWHAYEIAVGIRNLSVNEKNTHFFIQKGIMKPLVEMLDIDKPNEQESSLNAIWALITDAKKSEIQSDSLKQKIEKLENSEHEGVKQAAIRVKLKLEDTEKKVGELSRNSELSIKQCNYKRLARCFLGEFFKNLSKEYFNPLDDSCHCPYCHGARGDDIKHSNGNPPKDYGVPVGWYKFGLKLPPRANDDDLKIPQNWHIAYHGTRHEAIKGIFQVGEIVPSGSKTMSGKTIKELPGHFNDNVKPAGFNTKQVFLSPSIRYSGEHTYSPPEKWVHPTLGKTFYTKVAFQVWVHPESYGVGPETIAAQDQIDPAFDNQELEWSTDQHGAVILRALLVKLDENMPL